MFGLSLPWALGSTAILAVFIFFAGMDYGDKHGTNARKLANAQIQLEDTNKKLRVYNAQDEAEIRLQAALQDQAFDEASAALLKLGKGCPATQAMADILNRIR